MEKIFPKITVITPSFNQAAFLEETILSVLNQNYPNLEYIIIDGGSTDGSVDILKKYEDRLTYWISEKDSGQSEAINKGLRKSTGSILCWLCSDDLYTEGALLNVAAYFENQPEVGFIHGKSILFGEGKKEILVGSDREELTLKYFTVIPFPQPSSFFRRRIIEEQGILDESLHFGMDYDLLVRIALNYPILPVEDILSRYRLHNASKTVSQLSKFSKDWICVFSRFLRSVPIDSSTIETLALHGFYVDDGKRYNHSKEFSRTELKRITSYFLYNQLVIYYELYDPKMIKKILSLLLETDPEFYKEKGLRKTALKRALIPPVLFRFIRSILR